MKISARECPAIPAMNCLNNDFLALIAKHCDDLLISLTEQKATEVAA